MLCLYQCGGIIDESVGKLVDDSGVEMGAREAVEKDAIELARQKLIAATLSHQDEERFQKKAAVRQLIGTLIAARKRGLSFDRMAGVLAESGVEIAPETLRAYYFELKTEAELSAEHEKHARQLAKIQREIANTDLAGDLQFAAQAASEHVAQRSANRVRVNAFEGEGRPETASSQRGRSANLAPTGRKPTARSAAPAAQPASKANGRASVSAPEILDEVGTTSRNDERAGVTEHASIEQAQAAVATPLERIDGEPRPRSIEEIAAESVGQTVADLAENIHIRDNCVWYASGKPFDGFLGAKQLHLLRTVGRVIAPTAGRSSGDFVPMPRTL